MFESALSTIVATHKEKKDNSLPYVVAIASELAAAENKPQEKIGLKQSAEKII